MKFKHLVLMFAGVGVLCSGCNFKDKNSQETPKESSQPEEYINPFKSDETTPGDQGGEQTPDPVDPVIPEPVYEEPADSLEGIDANDMSGLYSAVNAVNDNYISTIKGYFNEVGGYDYYRHYQKNYVCDKTSFYTDNVQYTLPELNDYLSICNTGYLNKNNNYYKFSLAGSSKEERMSSALTSGDLTDEVSNKRYQDDMFTVNDLNQAYFEEKGFTRVSANKYECTDKNVCEEFISICATDLINQGYYLTFWKVTIEVNPDAEHALRIRLYVPSTQIGKLIDSHRDQENKPNWYLLFSEALISDVGTTTFAPANSLID